MLYDKFCIGTGEREREFILFEILNMPKTMNYKTMNYIYIEVILANMKDPS